MDIDNINEIKEERKEEQKEEIHFCPNDIIEVCVNPSNTFRLQ